MGGSLCTGQLSISGGLGGGGTYYALAGAPLTTLPSASREGTSMGCHVEWGNE